MSQETRGIRRKRQYDEINAFLNRSGSGLTYLRGRRRIGKSFLLKQVKQEHANAFYFVGAEDSTSSLTMRRFIKHWCEYSHRNTLLKLSSEFLTWDEIFNDITAYAREGDSSLLLIFDEIQWIARQRSGFVGLFKAAWEDWKSTGKIKVILCGSSNSFFAAKAGGDLEILRGLKTYAEIWVNQFSLKEVQDYYFPQWTKEQVCLSYMLVGGVPYYLEQFYEIENFIRSVNATLFSSGSIFLDEVDEILKLDFNSAGIKSVKKLLSAISIGGTTHKNIVGKSGLPKSSVSEYIAKLEDYQILFEHSDSLSGTRSQRYYFKDFYLHCYFNLLFPLAHQIRRNTNELIFPHKCLASNKGYYIPAYSGNIFELLVTSILERRETLPINEKLRLKDPNYSIETLFIPKTSQVDIVVVSEADREVRLIECKWLSDTNKLDKRLATSLSQKQVPIPKGFTRSNFIAVSVEPTEAFANAAKQGGVSIITLADLF